MARPSFLFCSALSREEIPEGVIIVLVEGCVNEGVEEGVGVTQPEKDTLPYWRNVAGAQRRDEFGQEEWDPAQDKHSDQDANHQSCALLFLLAPRLAVSLKSHRGMTNCEDHLRLLPGGFFYLREQIRNWLFYSIICVFFCNVQQKICCMQMHFTCK